MVSEARKQSMAWMETDYSKHTHFRWKVKWRLEHLGALGSMGETAPLRLIGWNFGHIFWGLFLKRQSFGSRHSYSNKENREKLWRLFFWPKRSRFQAEMETKLTKILIHWPNLVLNNWAQINKDFIDSKTDCSTNRPVCHSTVSVCLMICLSEL